MNRTSLRGGIGAGILAVLAVGMGAVLQSQANFSKNYVHDQLVEHKIRFAPVQNLRDEQRRVPCLVEYAGKPLTTAKQAECYAKYQVGLDLQRISGGKAYSETRYAAYLLRQKTAEAVANRPDDPATLALVKESAEQTRKADDLLAGEAVKGLLLTAYGFGLLGERGGQAATACFVIAGVLAAAMVVGLALAARSRRRHTAGAAEGAGAQRAPAEPPAPLPVGW